MNNTNKIYTILCDSTHNHNRDLFFLGAYSTFEKAKMNLLEHLKDYLDSYYNKNNIDYIIEIRYKNIIIKSKERNNMSYFDNIFIEESILQ